MLFRDINGNLHDITKYNYKNDKLYYNKIRNIVVWSTPGGEWVGRTKSYSSVNAINKLLSGF